MIAALTDADGRVTLPGFYDDVEEVSREERDMLAAVPYDEDKYKANVGVKTLFGEKGYTTLERTAIRPTFDVCGIWGGYTGEGARRYCRRKLTPNCRAGLFRIRIIIK